MKKQVDCVNGGRCGGANMCRVQIRQKGQARPAPKGPPVKVSTLHWLCTPQSHQRGTKGGRGATNICLERKSLGQLYGGETRLGQRRKEGKRNTFQSYN